MCMFLNNCYELLWFALGKNTLKLFSHTVEIIQKALFFPNGQHKYYGDVLSQCIMYNDLEIQYKPHQSYGKIP